MDPEREVMATLLTTNAQVVADVLRGSDNTPESDPAAVMRAIAATRSLAIVVDDTLRALVDRARRSGHTWNQIGEVLQVSRQAAFQRFGGRGQLAGGRDPVAMRPLLHASERAAPILKDFIAERWDQMRAQFDERMLEQCPVELLCSVRSKLDQAYGQLEELGKPAVSVRAGYTIVEVPMAFERGERVGQVTLDADKRVAGLFILPTDAA